MFKRPFSKNKTSLSGFRAIQTNLNRQKKLLHVAKSCLSEDLAQHCSHLTFKKNSITIYTDSSVWASKLLYMRPAIIDALSKHISDRIQTLNVKLLNNQTLHNESSPKSPSSQTIQHLAEANLIDNRDKLSTSMSKLINVLKKNKLSN